MLLWRLCNSPPPRFHPTNIRSLHSISPESRRLRFTSPHRYNPAQPSFYTSTAKSTNSRVTNETSQSTGQQQIVQGSSCIRQSQISNVGGHEKDTDTKNKDPGRKHEWSQRPWMAYLAVFVSMATIPATIVLGMQKRRKSQSHMREDEDFVRKGGKKYCRNCGQLDRRGAREV